MRIKNRTEELKSYHEGNLSIPCSIGGRQTLREQRFESLSLNGHGSWKRVDVIM